MSAAAASSSEEQDAVDALKKTKRALQQIHVHLQPFLERACETTPQAQAKARRVGATVLPHQQQYQRGLAQAAVALSLGTLRVIGARLRGKEEGKAANDPLRLQLNQCRKVLVQLQQKKKEERAKKQAAQVAQTTKTTQSMQQPPQQKTTNETSPEPTKAATNKQTVVETAKEASPQHPSSGTTKRKDPPPSEAPKESNTADQPRKQKRSKTANT